MRRGVEEAEGEKKRKREKILNVHILHNVERESREMLKCKGERKKED